MVPVMNLMRASAIILFSSVPFSTAVWEISGSMGLDTAMASFSFSMVRNLLSAWPLPFQIISAPS
ncbi:hypothetical protein D3C81_2210860 [compost metagenome]